MQLEDYFDFITPEDIRLKGNRIGIDDVLYYYLEGYTPEEIAANLPTLTLEQVYATITYYLHHQSEINRYLQELTVWREHRYIEQTSNPSPVVKRLVALKLQRGLIKGNHEGALPD